MNNSLSRLFDGVIETLRRDILPALEGEFVRGQTFGVIYALNSIKLRAAWSPEFLNAQLDALDELAIEIAMQRVSLPSLPTLDRFTERPSDPALLEQIRDAGDASVCAIIDWLHAAPDTLPPEPRRQLESAILAYVHRQLRHDIATSARPMFAEISSGVE